MLPFVIWTTKNLRSETFLKKINSKVNGSENQIQSHDLLIKGVESNNV